MEIFEADQLVSLDSVKCFQLLQEFHKDGEKNERSKSKDGQRDDRRHKERSKKSEDRDKKQSSKPGEKPRKSRSISPSR